MSLKASISGIRGIVGESLTPQVILDYTAAFSAILKEGKILLGRDSRPSGIMIASLVKSVLNACGRNVVDIGIVPTPVVVFGVLNSDDFAGGVIITASHNTEEYNALKFVNDRGKFLSPAEFILLSNKMEEKKFNYCLYSKIGKNYNDKDITALHINKIFDFINNSLIKKAKLKVALDAVNGAGGPHTINFLQKLGCEVLAINEHPTGIFPHPPEPKPNHLNQLSNFIKANKVDIGFALDPDADRLVVADEKGNILSEELTLAICVKHFLANYKKTDIVINLSTSRVINDIAEEFNCKVIRVPTGEINVTEKMEELNCLIGGEGNGGVILPKLNKCRDSLVGIALILELLAKQNHKTSEIADDFPKYVFIKDKISSEMVNYANILENIIIEFKTQTINTEDGIRIDFQDKWVLFRKSNTEPIIRIYAESKSEEISRELINKIKKICNVNS